MVKYHRWTALFISLLFVLALTAAAVFMRFPLTEKARAFLLAKGQGYSLRLSEKDSGEAPDWLLGVSQGIVLIEVVGSNGEIRSRGGGLVLTTDGLIVTHSSLLKDAGVARIIFQNSVFDAPIFRVSRKDDLVLFQTPEKFLQALVWSDDYARDLKSDLYVAHVSGDTANHNSFKLLKRTLIGLGGESSLPENINLVGFPAFNEAGEVVGLFSESKGRELVSISSVAKLLDEARSDLFNDLSN